MFHRRFTKWLWHSALDRKIPSCHSKNLYNNELENKIPRNLPHLNTFTHINSNINNRYSEIIVTSSRSYEYQNNHSAQSTHRSVDFIYNIQSNATQTKTAAFFLWIFDSFGTACFYWVVQNSLEMHFVSIFIFIFIFIFSFVCAWKRVKLVANDEIEIRQHFSNTHIHIISIYVYMNCKLLILLVHSVV